MKTLDPTILPSLPILHADLFNKKEVYARAISAVFYVNMNANTIYAKENIGEQ